MTAVWAHEVGGSRMLLGVSIKQRYAGHSKQAGHVAAMCHAGAYAGKYVIVVDDDIDVSNLEELMWAMLTRSDPATSIDIITKTWSTPLDPRSAARTKGKRQQHQLARDHRRLPPVPLARQLPEGQHAQRVDGSQGAAEVRLPAEVSHLARNSLSHNPCHLSFSSRITAGSDNT